MAAPSKIAELRDLLARQFPEAHPARTGRTPPTSESLFRTGLATLDAIGMPKGALTELVSARPSAGGALTVSGLIRSALTQNNHSVLIDGRDAFDPQSHTPDECRKLLWIRCQNASQAVQAADLLLRDGNFPFLILDLQLNSSHELNRIRNPIWFRLQTLVDRHWTTCLILTPKALVSSARLRIRLGAPYRLDALGLQRSRLVGQIRPEVMRRRNGVPIGMLSEASGQTKQAG